VIIYGVNIGYQNLWSPLHQKQIFNTARCLETAFYSLEIYVLIFYVYFNLNNLSDAVYQLSVAECIFDVILTVHIP